MEKSNYKKTWLIIISVVVAAAIIIGTPVAIEQRKITMKERQKEKEIEMTVPATDPIPTETEAVIETEPIETEPPTEPGPHFEPKDGYKEVNEDVWARQDVNVRAGPGTDWKKLGILGKNQQVKRIGIGEDKWSMIVFEGQVAYVSTNYLLLEDPTLPDLSK